MGAQLDAKADRQAASQRNDAAALEGLQRQVDQALAAVERLRLDSNERATALHGRHTELARVAEDIPRLREAMLGREADEEAQWRQAMAELEAAVRSVTKEREALAANKARLASKEGDLAEQLRAVEEERYVVQPLQLPLIPGGSCCGCGLWLYRHVWLCLCLCLCLCAR